jgi:thiol:disulfide interchange protein
MMNASRIQKAALLILFAFALGFYALPSGPAGQEIKPENPMPEITLSFDPDTLKLGEVATLSVKIEVPERYHFYSMTRIPEGPLPLQVTTADKAVEALGSWFGPKPHVEMDPNFKKEVEFYGPKDDVVYRRNFRVVSKPEAAEILFRFRGQICDEKQCIPVIEKIKVALGFEEGGTRKEHSEPPKLEGIEFSEKAEQDDTAAGSLKTKGFWGVLIIGFLAGLGALITPCVFPMIPITVSFFSKFSKVSLRRSLTMGGIYAVSIMLVFTLVGIVISAIWGAAGMQKISTHPAFNVFLFALLVVFAFNLFGMFEIRVPSWLISKTSQKEQELTAEDGSLFHQGLGVFFMAITFTLVSFTCTVAFIGIVLAAAADGEWFYPTVGMLAFSFAFAVPFFFLAVFPNMAGKLQGKGGDWMVAVKVSLGFIELAASMKFLSNLDLQYEWGVVSRPFALVFWTGICAFASLYLLRVFALPHNDTEAKFIGPVRMAFALLFFLLAVHSGYGITHTRSMGGWLDGWLPPPVLPYQSHTGESSGEQGKGILSKFSHDNIAEAMERARREKKALFIDFTGYNCTNCRYMESNMFPRPEVIERLEKMVLMSAFTDGVKEVHEQQRAMQVKNFGVVTLPYYVIVNPFVEKISKKTALAIHPDMTEKVPQYLAFLDKGLAAWEEIKKEMESAGKKPEAGPVKDGGEEFEFPNLKTGEKFKLSSLRGDWIFVNFWASWCGPCKKELEHDFPPALATAPHIKLVTIAFDSDETKVGAVSFADKVKLWKYPTLQGPEDPEEAGFPAEWEATNNLPISYLISPKGYLVWKQKASITKELLIELFKKAKEAADEDKEKLVEYFKSVKSGDSQKEADKPAGSER